MALSNEKLVAAYSQMKLIRAFEEGLHEEAEANNVFGFAHFE